MRILIVLLMLVYGGCSGVHYISPDGSELKYKRVLGKQKIKGFRVEVNADGSKSVKFDSSSGDNTEMATTAKNLSEFILKAGLIP